MIKFAFDLHVLKYLVESLSVFVRERFDKLTNTTVDQISRRTGELPPFAPKKSNSLQLGACTFDRQEVNLFTVNQIQFRHNILRLPTRFGSVQ